MKKIIMIMMACLVSLGMMAAKENLQVVVLGCELHCQGCCDKVMKNIAFEKGVKDLACDLKHQMVTVTYDANKTNVEKLQKAFDKIGKPARVITEDELNKQKEQEKKQLLDPKMEVNPHKLQRAPGKEAELKKGQEIAPRRMEKVAAPAPQPQEKKAEKVDATTGASQQQ